MHSPCRCQLVPRTSHKHVLITNGNTFSQSKSLQITCRAKIEQKTLSCNGERPCNSRSLSAHRDPTTALHRKPSSPNLIGRVLEKINFQLMDVRVVWVVLAIYVLQHDAHPIQFCFPRRRQTQTSICGTSMAPPLRCRMGGWSNAFCIRPTFYLGCRPEDCLFAKTSTGNANVDAIFAQRPKTGNLVMKSPTILPIFV